jgi:predicted DNA binding CopG/RHH family protein
MEIEERMENLIEMLNEINQRLDEKVKEKELRPIIEKGINPENLKKNSHLHILLETPLMNKIRQRAKEKGLSIGEFVRSKLREQEQLDRIEGKIDKIILKEKC